MRWQTQEQYLRNLLAQQLEIPMLGKIFFAVAAGSATSLYEEWARTEMDIPAELLFTGAKAPAQAFEACSGYRNDVVCVFPGAYDIDTSLDWTKENTHLVGMGGPNVRADYSEKNCVIYTDTAAIDYTIHLTGNHCQFLNVGINNAGANAGNFSPLYVNGYGNLFKNVGLIGNMAAEQLADDDCASLHIGTNAHNCKWINCDIGEDCWGARSAAYSGQVSFIGSQPNGGLFKNCLFRSQSITTTVAMVTTYKAAAGTTHIGRGWIFDDCKFMNFAGTTGLTAEMVEVFYMQNPAGQNSCLPVLLHNCSSQGYNKWSQWDAVTRIFGTMAAYDDSGGLACRMDDANE